MYSENTRGRKGSGMSHAPGASRYFWFQRSRSSSEDEKDNDMLDDSNLEGNAVRIL
jgi:hypothetical protein